MHKDKPLPKEGVIKQYPPKETPTEPVKLPEGFYWEDFDPMDDKQGDEVCNFIMDHYVESSSGEFRLIYTIEKVRWAMCAPGHLKELFYCVRDDKTKKI